MRHRRYVELVTVIRWNGDDLPLEMRSLPPGTYVLQRADGLTSLTRTRSRRSSKPSSPCALDEGSTTKRFGPEFCATSREDRLVAGSRRRFGGELTMEMLLDVRFGYGASTPWSTKETIWSMTFRGQEVSTVNDAC